MYSESDYSRPGVTFAVMASEGKKVPVSAKVDPSVVDAVQALADDDERSFSFMVEKALKLLLASHDPKWAKGGVGIRPPPGKR